MIIVVDRGHGGQDSGAVSGNILEKNINKLVGDRVVYHLKRHNQTVIETRKNDDTVSLDERVRIIKTYNCDVGISIHCNSFNETTAQGVETYTWGKGIHEIRLAEYIHKSILEKGLYNKDRGIKQAEFRVLSPNIPICLVELGFISNQADLSLILEHIEDFAIAITKGLLKFKDISYIEDKPIEVTPGDKLYYVQVGAYANLENAKAKVEELKNKGIDSFIKC